MSQSKERFKYVAVDWVTANVAFLCFDVFRAVLSGTKDVLSYLLDGKIVAEQIAIPFMLLGVYWCSGFYNRPFGKSRLQEFLTTVCSSGINALLIYLSLLINDHFGERVINYEQLSVLFGALTVFTYIGRVTVSQTALRKFREHNWSFRVLIIGNSEHAHKVAEQLMATRSRMSYEIAGFVDIDGEEPAGGSASDIKGENLEKECRRLEIEQLILVPQTMDENKVLKILDKLFRLDLPIKISPDTMSYVTSSIRMLDIYGEPFVDLTTPAMSESAKNMKRLSDVVMSALALILLSPLMAVLAVMVRLDSKGPAIYSQERVGRLQRPFRIFKFRTMRTDAEAEGPRLSRDDDPRVTKAGHIMRKYRLDELPQFWNVLIGDMSIVGPRPERRYFIDKILEKAPYYTLVYQVRPGITSWGMVKYGYASNVDQMVARTRYDLIYMGNMSMFVDLKILIYTVKTVLTGQGL